MHLCDGLAANEALTDTALQFVKAFPLLPIPMIPSPLYMLLNDTDAEANKYPVVKNSFELLRFFSWAEKIIYEQCDEVSKTRKKKAHDEIQRWLVSVRIF